MRKVIFLSLFIFPLCLFASIQTANNSFVVSLTSIKEDTLRVNQFNKITLQNINVDSTKAFYYAVKALQLAKKIQWKEGIAKSNFYLGQFYNAHFNYNKALIYFNQSLNTSNPKMLSIAFQNMGAIYIYKSNYSKALEYYYSALKIVEGLNDKNEIAKISINLGSTYYGIRDYSKALQYFNKAEKMLKKEENINDLAWVNRNIGAVYNSLDQFEKALFYYKKATVLSEKSKDKMLQARILSGIALVYFNLKDYNQAIYNSQLSLKMTVKGTKDKQIIAFSRGVLADSYIEKAKRNTKNKILLDSAIFNLNNAVKLHQQINSGRDLVYDYTSLSQIHKLKGDYKNALKAIETSILYKDSIFNSDNKETIKNLEDKRTIELRDKQIELNQLTIESKEKQKWYFIFGILSLGIIGSLLFYQNRNRKKVNEKLQLLNRELDQANKIKTRFFSILNHDLRSPVSNLIHFLHLQKDSPELLNEESRKRMENKTIEGAENLLNSMEDILLWSKGQMENFEPKIKMILAASIFEDIQNHFASEEKIKIQFENFDHISIATDENYLKTIMRNLTGNAIKALGKTEDPSIIWKAWQENGNSYLSITDNGPGGSQEQFKALYDETEVVGIKTGLGLHLIRDLAKAIDCKITVDFQPSSGTIFTLILP